MFFNYLNKIRATATVLIGSTCLLGDYLFNRNNNHHILKSLTDNITHSLIGLFCAIIIVNYYQNAFCRIESLLLVLTSFLISSIIDVDHFIEAKSLSLIDATSLHTRPFLHCSTLPILILFLLVIISLTCKSLDKSARIKVWLSVISCAILSHHIRDGTRRGLWIYPFGSTPNIPYYGYVLLTMILPHLFAGFIKIIFESKDKEIVYKSVLV